MIHTIGLVAPRLITDEASGLAIAWGTVVPALLVVCVCVACVVIYRKARDRSDHADRAARRLSRQLGLDDRERSALHALSAASQIHASALLISRRAFERSVELAGGSSRPPKPAVVTALAQKLHPGAL